MIKRNSSEAIFGLDALRGFAIVLMLITHGFRLFINGQGSYSPGVGFAERLLHFFAVIEPYTSSLFLFLVGIGVHISFNKTKKPYLTWLGNNINKSIQLYIIGIVLFFMEYGFQKNDIFFSPSILSTIALSTIALSSSLKFNYGPMVGLVLAGITTYVFQGIPLSGINAGPGGAFPLIMFTFGGYLLYDLMVKDKNKTLIALSVIGVISWFFPFAPQEEWIRHYQSTYKLFLTGPTGIDYWKSGGEGNIFQVVSFWNHSLTSWFRISLVLFLSLKMFLKFENKLKGKFYGEYLSLIGRHALGCYILHLTIIAVFDILKIYPQTPEMDWVFILFLILCCGIYSKFKDNKIKI